MGQSTRRIHLSQTSDNPLQSQKADYIVTNSQVKSEPQYERGDVSELSYFSCQLTQSKLG